MIELCAVHSQHSSSRGWIYQLGNNDLGGATIVSTKPPRSDNGSWETTPQRDPQANLICLGHSFGVSSSTLFILYLSLIFFISYVLSGQSIQVELESIIFITFVSETNASSPCGSSVGSLGLHWGYFLYWGTGMVEVTWVMGFSAPSSGFPFYWTM